MTDPYVELVNKLTESRDGWRRRCEEAEEYAKILEGRIERLLADNHRMRQVIAKAARRIELGMPEPWGETETAQ